METATIGDNKPPEPIETFKERADAYVANAASFVTITDANETLATDHFNLGTTLAQEIEAERVKLKKPHLDAGTLVDTTFKPVHGRVETERVALRTRLEGHARAKRAAADKIAREAAQALAEAQEAIRKAAEAAKVEEHEEDPFLAATAPVVATPDIAALAAEAKLASLRTVTAGQVGAASGGRTFAVRAAPRTAEITDAAALAAYLVQAGHSEMNDLLQKLANQNARAKGSIAWPGTKFVGGE